MCKIEKDTTFTHFASKWLHTSASKLVYIFSLATVTVYIYTVTVTCVFIILLIFVRTNFSLSSPCTTTSTPHLLFLRCTQTHPYTNTSTQTNQHRNTPTNKPTQTNQPRDRSVLMELSSWIGRWRSDLGRGAWFMDRPVKKGSGSAGEERTRWRSDLGW